MRLAKVVGNLVSTVKHSSNLGQKLMIVQPIDASSNFSGDEFVAVDKACAGIGDYVLVTDEGGAAMIAAGQTVIVDATILGVLDEIPNMD